MGMNTKCMTVKEHFWSIWMKRDVILGCGRLIDYHVSMQIACINNKQVDTIDHVDPYFTKFAYVRTYSGRINVLKGTT